MEYMYTGKIGGRGWKLVWQVIISVKKIVRSEKKPRGRILKDSRIDSIGATLDHLRLLSIRPMGVFYS